MNTDQLARATFVINRSTHGELAAIASRMGVSRSTLVRDILAEPVALMAKWVESLPPGNAALTAEAVSDFHDTMQLDLVEFIERAVSDVDKASGKGDE